MMKLDFNMLLKWKRAVVLFVIFAVCLFDFFPKINKLYQLKVKEKTVQTAVETISESGQEKKQAELQDELRQRQEDLALIQQAVDSVRRQIIQEKNIPLITLELERQATSSEIELISIRPLPSDVKEEFEVVPIEIGFRNEYQQLMKLLSQMETSSVPMTVQGLSIRKGDILIPELDMNLTLHVLFAMGKETTDNPEEEEAVRHE